ncbi:MAG TPA: TolC family protein [Mucilaginibacter sp.]|nr:TolC family protein [Mucilaginibacter sp.]
MKTKTISFFTLLIVLLISGKVNAQVLPLDSVLARIGRSPALLAYDAKAGAQDAYAAGAGNLDAPRISAGQYQTPYSLNPNMGSFMVQVEQMFTNPAKLKAKAAYQQELSKVAAEDKNYLKNQLFAQARQYYLERVVLEKKLALLQNTAQLLDYMLKDANIRLTYGKEKLNNIYKAKAQLYELDNTKEQLNNEINQRNVMLNTLMNQDKQATFSVDTSLVIPILPALTDTAVLAAARSDIRSIDRSIQLNRLNAQVEYSQRKPDFGIQAGHMFSYGGSNQYVLMGSVTIPIVPWASKAYRANLKGIRMETEELQQKRLDILNQAAGQLASLKVQLSSQKKQLANYQLNIIPALQNSYKTALLAYDQNTGDLPSVLNSVNDLQNARMAALDRLQDIIKLQVAYEKELERY